MEFKDLGLSPNLLTAIQKLGFKEPTKIQKLSIPLIVNGKDVVGESATGSGKTLAFGAGVIQNVNPKKGLQAIVLTPTRELAEQVKDALKRMTHDKHLKIISVYGGVSINPQIDALRQSEVVVATPGRFLDHLERRTIDTSKVKLLVLDEADRMFDMGFIDDVEKIIKSCPQKRQTMFFSATISDRIKDLAKRHMKDHEIIMATKMVDPSKLKQVYYDISKNMKFSLLVHMLKKEREGLVMVFCNTRRNVDFVGRNLKLNGIRAITIHGGLTQNKRTRTISTFNDGKVNVLVCTDVAARGLHIDNVSHVYNYDLPKDPTDYVHRIGRTARAGEAGQVINLLCELDYGNFGRIQDEHRNYKISKEETPKITKAKMNIESRRGDRRGRKPSYGGRGFSGGNSRGGGLSAGKGRRSAKRKSFGKRENKQKQFQQGNNISSGSWGLSPS